MNNKITGNHYESELCDRLSDYGFWAHNLAQNQHGQPADVLAVRNNVAYLIDCKDCEDNKFPLSRIEPNQEAAMTLWDLCGNSHAYFALRLTSRVTYMVSFRTLNLLDQLGKKSLSEEEIKCFPTLLQWEMEVSAHEG